MRFPISGFYHIISYNITEPHNAEQLRQQLNQLLDLHLNKPQPEQILLEDPEKVRILEERAREVRRLILTLRSQLSHAKTLEKESSNYNKALQIQSGRMRTLSLFTTKQPTGELCPICNQPLHEVAPNLNRLRSINDEVRLQLADLTSASPTLNQYIRQIQQQIEERKEELSIIEGELGETNRVQASELTSQSSWAEQQRILGAISLYTQYTNISDPKFERLKEKHLQEKRKAISIEKRLEELNINETTESAKYQISNHMTRLGRKLMPYDNFSTLRIDYNYITVIRDTPNGRPERLNEIGGGENWVSYHLSAMLALHRFFIEANRPVPSILILDQPSQIYFPEESESSSSEKSTDWTAVRRIYQVIFEEARNLNNRLQIIILDHANFKYEEFTNAVRVNWRNGKHFV